ncbi:YiaA/B two helix domain protein [Leptospira ryugenii]|uniref:YiaA/B two helix domain protein n=1 Tax=Leptospira ryugenii TaxID=1917863 RepID=A0A2P2E2W0_9LEPT|nr:inner membrane protein YiaA [Leptospira ryugenii]GBF51228.1 YiaA/B two helix domain protein [Leptospira ryugenii]
MSTPVSKPSVAFVGASWLSLLIGMGTFMIGIWNSEMMLSEKGFYLTILMYGLFSSVSLQKTVRDQLEGLFVTGIYFGLCWFSVILSLLLLLIGLWNAELSMSEKGFFGISFVLSMYAAVAVQKNVRDARLADMESSKQL